jgi:hypothetical protein
VYVLGKLNLGHVSKNFSGLYALSLCYVLDYLNRNSV